LKKHGFVRWRQRSVELGLLLHLVKLAPSILLVLVARHVMDMHDNLASFFELALHQQVPRRLWRPENNEELEDGEDECKAKWSAPLRTRVGLIVVESETHVRGERVAESDAHSIHADEKATQLGWRKLGTVDRGEGEETPRASASYQAEDDEHCCVD